MTTLPHNSGSVIPVPSTNGASSQVLGQETLANLLEASLDGIVVIDEQRRYLYVNPAARKVLGYGQDDREVIGRDFLSNVPKREHERILSHFQESLNGRPGHWKSIIMPTSGEERHIEYSTMRVIVDGKPCAAAILRDVTHARRLEREGTAFIDIASQVAYGGSLDATLHVLCKHVVDATGIVAASVGLHNEATGILQVEGFYGPKPEYIAEMNKLLREGVRTPTIRAFDEGKPVHVKDARKRMLADPAFAKVHKYLVDSPWDTVVSVPLIYRGQTKGILMGYYPWETELSQDEIQFLSAIANQASVAVENARLMAEVQSKAAVDERARLARELHDSVTQALFSINLTARSIEVNLERDGNTPAVKQKLNDLRQLTQGALAEMRALIFELRPGSLEEEGLVQAIRKHAAAVQGRELIQIDVEGSENFPRLAGPVEEALYRIAQEAIHNVTKHAEASHISVRLTADDEYASLSVQDDGKGFDPASVPPGHMGLSNMCQRAETFGGDCSLESLPGQGTTMKARVPVKPNRKAG